MRLCPSDSMFLSMQGITVETCIWGTNADVLHSVASAPPSPFAERSAHSPLCPERWQAAWTGPNATVGGLWNNSVAKLAEKKKTFMRSWDKRMHEELEIIDNLMS